MHGEKYIEEIDALRTYLDISVVDALKSDDPFIRAMAMIDRRVGSERLRKHKPKSSDHSLIRLFYDLRVQCAQIVVGDRGRDTSCPVPPAQTRTGAH
jgi:hypothetical protein